MMGNEGVFHLGDGGNSAPQVYWVLSENPTHSMLLKGKRVGVEPLPPKQSPRFWGNLLRLAELRENAPWAPPPEFDEEGEPEPVAREIESPLAGRPIYFCLLPEPVRQARHQLPVREAIPVHVGTEGHPWPAWAQGEEGQTGPEENLFNHIHMIERDSPSPWIG